MSDKKKSLLNISVAIFFKILLLIFSFWVRRLLIQYLGNEYNGINSLFTSIIGILSIAELGVGSAITFCMYRPIVEKNDAKIAALYNLFRKLYSIIGIIILVAGLVVSIFLPYLAKDYTISSGELYRYFYLFLLSSVLTYFFGAKTSLICAHKNNYISTTIASLVCIFQQIIQILGLIYFRSFYIYLIAKSIDAVVQYIFLTIYCERYYKKYIHTKNVLQEQEKKDVKKNIAALFLHQITAMIFSSVDNLVISAMFGVIILGKYANYYLILSSMNEVIKLIFTSLTSIIGQLIVKKEKREINRIYSMFNNLNIIVGFVFYLGYYAIINELITFCFGDDLLLDTTLVILLTCTYFIQYLRQACANFKDSAGLFYKDRYIAVITAFSNVVLSIIFAYLFGIYGVLLATLLIIVLIYHPVDSYILHKYLFERKPYWDLMHKLVAIIVFVGAVFLMHYVHIKNDKLIIEIIENGFVSVGISLVCVGILELPFIRKDFKLFKEMGFLKKHRKKEEEENNE